MFTKKVSSVTKRGGRRMTHLQGKEDKVSVELVNGRKERDVKLKI